MLREVNIAKQYFQDNFKGQEPLSGDYAVPISTSRGDAFMKVVLQKSSEGLSMGNFRLYWDEELTVSWYEHNPDGSRLENLVEAPSIQAK